ncbi:uncharacterized protein [Palaemon carinicauda]|uniref:uncharacterized protein n=1 Tax=Palaemon carinicauda TaxID=392227 RepID=UPI0035B677CE
MYIQKDGVAMGSPLGVLFANFHMGVVEERVFLRIGHPDVYVRYIDDTFVMAPSAHDIETLSRTIYIKPTNLDLCLNGDSECPARYKASTVKAYIHRALSHCSSLADTHQELDRVTQVLVNNGYSNIQLAMRSS